MLERKYLRYLLKKHRAKWILAVFGEEVDLDDLKELVDEEGREEDKKFLNQLFLNNKKININEVRK
jgi:hypothetical protein